MSNGDVYPQDFSSEFFLDQDASSHKTKPPTKLKKLRGIKRRVLKKLREVGIHYVEFLVEMSIEEIVSATELRENVVKTLVKKARKRLFRYSFKNGYEFWQERQKINKLTTGSASLDELFGGGVEPKAITEFFGEYSTGKTQIAHQLCVNVQLPYREGGFEGRALYIDTEGTFRPERIIHMARAKFLDCEKTLANITYGMFSCSDDQMLFVEELEFVKDMVKQKNIKLVVVDTIISNFRSEFIGKEKLVERQQKIKSFVHALMNLTEKVKELAVIVLNQVSCDPDVVYGDKLNPTGGNAIAHSSTYRIRLKKGKGDQRVAKLESAPHLPEKEATFCITEGGITD